MTSSDPLVQASQLTQPSEDEVDHVRRLAALAGPDDPLDGFDSSRVPQLMRDIFTAAGGTHEDWATYDRVMAEERRTAVLVEMDRVYR